MLVARPEDDEFAPGMPAGYIVRVQGDVDPVQALALQRDEVVAQFRPLSDAKAAHRYAHGKWSIKQLLGHLTDAERIFSYRLLRIARGDTTPLPGFEENDYVEAAGSDLLSIVALIEEWRCVRAATISLAGNLQPDAWTRRGTSNGHTVSARALVYLILGHTDHHRQILQDRYGLTRMS